MALVKSKLETKIREALMYGQSADPESNPDDILNETAKMIADAIDSYIKSADILVKVEPGIIVATAGSPAAQTGATTSPGIGKSTSIL